MLLQPPTITTTNIETLLVATEKEDKIAPPPEHIQDKVAFIFNNLAQVNLPQKVSVITDMFFWTVYLKKLVLTLSLSSGTIQVLRKSEIVTVTFV